MAIQRSKGAASTNLVLKLGMKSVSGEIVWATLLASTWNDAVQNGDEIRVQVDDPKDEQSDSYDPTTNVTFKFTDKPSWNYGVNPKYAISLLPKTYEVGCSCKNSDVHDHTGD